MGCCAGARAPRISESRVWRADGEGTGADRRGGNEITCAAVRALVPHVIGRTIEEIFAAPAAFWRSLTADPQLRWIGREKGVIHMAAVAWTINQRRPSSSPCSSMKWFPLPSVANSISPSLRRIASKLGWLSIASSRSGGGAIAARRFRRRAGTARPSPARTRPAVPGSWSAVASTSKPTASTPHGIRMDAVWFVARRSTLTLRRLADSFLRNVLSEALPALGRRVALGRAAGRTAAFL